MISTSGNLGEIAKSNTGLLLTSRLLLLEYLLLCLSLDFKIHIRILKTQTFLFKTHPPDSLHIADAHTGFVPLQVQWRQVHLLPENIFPVFDVLRDLR